MLNMHRERSLRLSLETQEMTLNQVVSEKDGYIGRDWVVLQAKKRKRKPCEQKPLQWILVSSL